MYTTPAATASTERFDAVVVGGGPAGSVAAIGLADLGWSVLLAERRRAGETKACGHCLHPRGAALMRRDGGLRSVLDAVSGGLTTSARFIRPGGRVSIRAPFGRGASGRHDGMDDHEQSQSQGVIVRRDRFDHALLELARARGVVVYEATSARPLDARRQVLLQSRDSDQDQRIVIAEHLLIDASGVHSALDSHVPLMRMRTGRGFGFSFDIDPHEARGIEMESGEIMMFVDRRGYLGLVRERDGCVHVGGYVRRAHGGGWLEVFLDRMMSRALMTSKAGGATALSVARNARRVNMRACGPMPRRVRPVAGSWFARIGDAAGYAEPLTGEGIAWAISSAMMLVDAVRSNRGDWDDRAANAYVTVWRREAGRGVARAVMFGRAASILSRIPWPAAPIRWAQPLTDRLIDGMMRSGRDIDTEIEPLPGHPTWTATP